MIYTWSLTGSNPNDYTFASNSTLSNCEIHATGNFAGVALTPNWFAVDANTQSMWKFRSTELTAGTFVSLGTDGYVVTPNAGLHGYADTPQGQILRSITPITTVTEINAAAGLSATWGGLANGVDRCIEAWVYVPLNERSPMGVMPVQVGAASYVIGEPNYQYVGSSFWGQRRMSYKFCARQSVMNVNNQFPVDQWMHICGTVDHANNIAAIWKNGTVVTSTTTSGKDTSFGTYYCRVLGGGGHSQEMTVMGRFSQGTPRYPGSTPFTPTLMSSSGTVMLTHGLGAGKILSGIDWGARSGASYGYISQVEVNTGSDGSPNWVAVGGTNPTPPLTGLNYTVPQDCVRFTLTAKADTNMTDTPILRSAMLELSDADPGSASSVRHESGYGVVWETSGMTAVVQSAAPTTGDSYLASESDALRVYDADTMLESIG